MKLSTTEITVAVDGELYGDPQVVSGLAVDSRLITGGELFVPLRAVRDGHDWIDAALAAGATAYLTEHEPRSGTAVRVSSTSDALAELGAYARTKAGPVVVGVTGSVGKTTTKDMIYAVLSRKFVTHASNRSCNNEIGVPLTLVNAPDNAEALVVELGARAPRDITVLCEIVRPTIGVVTRVARVHTEGLGGIEGVARVKRELVEALPADGTAVLNSDDLRVAAMASATEANVVTFGSRGDVYGELITIGDDLRPVVRIHTPSDAFEARLSACGEHQLMNALAASAVAFTCEVPAPETAQGLECAQLSPLRMSLSRNDRGVMVLDDSYNASPVSVEAALRSLAALPARRRVAVLGIMAELGADEVPEHRKIAALAHSMNIELVAVEAPQFGVPYLAKEDVTGHLADLAEGDSVLVKGSRVAGLDQVAAALREIGENLT
jgi:UDP-N-acetylmuramoyl-tripeptide--D-alanyl-D-alanine ligase